MVGSVLAARVVVSKPLTSLEFRLSLVHALTQPLLATRLGPGRTPSTQETRLMGKHFPYHSELRRRCVVCAYKKTTPRGRTLRGTKTKTWCPKCEQHLCMGKCFELYHTRLHYRLQAGSHWNHNKDARSFWNHLATLQELVSHNKLFD